MSCTGESTKTMVSAMGARLSLAPERLVHPDASSTSTITRGCEALIPPQAVRKWFAKVLKEAVHRSLPLRLDCAETLSKAQASNSRKACRRKPQMLVERSSNMLKPRYEQKVRSRVPSLVSISLLEAVHDAGGAGRAVGGKPLVEQRGILPSFGFLGSFPRRSLKVGVALKIATWVQIRV